MADVVDYYYLKIWSEIKEQKSVYQTHRLIMRTGVFKSVYFGFKTMLYRNRLCCRKNFNRGIIAMNLSYTFYGGLKTMCSCKIVHFHVKCHLFATCNTEVLLTETKHVG